MSDNVPFELQVEIIKRVAVPVKSLVQFRSVSKQWKSLIDSSEFITYHTLKQSQLHHLLVRYTKRSEIKYISIVDDDSFPRHKFSPTVSPTAKLLTHPRMMASSHGLVCLCGFAYDLKKHLIVLWNPSIRKSVEIELPNKLNALGFGVCPKTMDPKIVRITRRTNARVYTLSSGAWRRVSMNLRVPPGFTFCSYELQDSIEDPEHLCISKRKESLVVLNYDKSDVACVVWMMTKNGDPKSLLTKLFTVSFNAFHDSVYHRIVGFRKNGEPIIERLCSGDGGFRVTTLEVYEPCVENSNDLWINTPFMIKCDSFFMTTSYTESLLLLNHPDSIIH
ncbi:putative F-box domain-containing protein [Helianthus annuus]|nr:putative F-box domain-containing protein [Helianthus annuus]